jgi:hypothetical protein
MTGTGSNPAVAAQRPTLVTALALITLLSGLVNIAWGIVSLGTIVGLLCAPITVSPIVLGAFEVGYAAKLLGPADRKGSPARGIAVFEIGCLIFGNVFSPIVGILALIFYHDPAVDAYFAGASAPVAPSEPAGL